MAVKVVQAWLLATMAVVPQDCVAWQALKPLLGQGHGVGCQEFIFASSCVQDCCHGLGAQLTLSCSWHTRVPAAQGCLHLNKPICTGLGRSNIACLLMLGVPFLESQECRIASVGQRSAQPQQQSQCNNLKVPSSCTVCQTTAWVLCSRAPAAWKVE